MGLPGDPVVKTSIAGGARSIPPQIAKIPHALWPRNQNIKQKQYCNKFNKEFKIVHGKKKKLKKKRARAMKFRLAGLNLDTANCRLCELKQDPLPSLVSIPSSRKECNNISLL